MSLPINICRVAPKGYAHARAFDEVTAGLAWAFQAVGKEVTVRTNELLGRHTNILVGANLLTAEQCESIPSGTIIYNLEQIDDSSTWLTSHYRNILARVRVLDYSEGNAHRLSEMTGNPNIRVLPVAYWPGLSCISPALAEDIDVLFYGSMNERRQKIIDALQARGLVVANAFCVYGAQRDALIARAKVVLNIHYYESSIFEVVRSILLLANRKAVVSELGTNTEIYPWLRDSCAFANYDKLVALTETLVTDAALRKRIADNGYQCALRCPLDSLIAPLTEFLDNTGSPRTQT